MKPVALILRVHAALLALYPAGFRHSYADEMQAVFAAILADAAQRGWRPLLRACWRELGGLLTSLVSQHWHNLWRLGRERRMAMSPLTAKVVATLKPTRLILFVAGCLVLGWAWSLVTTLEQLFAESHLASYYCCLTPQELANLSRGERALQQFFTTAPGTYLPGLLFISGNLALLVRGLRRSANIAWLLFIFALFNLVYVLVAFLSVGLSWSISNWIVGPRTTPYKGYERTWYGILLHFALWVGFFSVILRVSRPAATTALVDAPAQ